MNRSNENLKELSVSVERVNAKPNEKVVTGGVGVGAAAVAASTTLTTPDLDFNGKPIRSLNRMAFEQSNNHW